MFRKIAAKIIAIVGLVGGLFTAIWVFNISPQRTQLNLTPLSTDGSPFQGFRPRPIGLPFDTPPRISYVQIVDLNSDGKQDVLVCDCTKNTVSWLRQESDGTFVEQVITDQLIAPARLDCTDVDHDGDLDLIVAVLGKLFPSNEKLGSLVALENKGQEVFEPHVLLESVARVSDVRCADLDCDQDLDLVVTQFGYDEGEIRWLENVGSWKYESRPLQSRPGGIHSIPVDLNSDGNLDIVSLISQEDESIFAFIGDGKGNFREQELFSANNPDFGSSGIWVNDLDADGAPDILFCNGDAFDYFPPRPWPWHGVQWLENKGDLRFEFHRLADFGGAVNAQVIDIGGDGDLDIVVSSAFNDWAKPTSQSLRLLENVGTNKYLNRPITNSPSHIQALAIGDVNNDGLPDLVTGGMHISAPHNRVGRITLWLAQAE
ncbi:MAG: VCBS repeat-containing protein [Planctomycetales bacterium]|nr:VCBS repeat-containing protein [Planctomycetales bacterium]